MLWNWGHPRFHFLPLPKAAAWLNLIEGFWKILRQRALAGRAGTSTDDVEQAGHAGVDDGNRQPTPFLWGRPPKPQRQFKHQFVYRI
jgi:transposase